MAKFTQTSMNYFWKLKWKNFMFHWKEITSIANEEHQGQDPANPANWNRIAPPRTMPATKAPPTEEEFVDNPRIDISQYQQELATQQEKAGSS
jgi:hypothetical protein